MSAAGWSLFFLCPPINMWQPCSRIVRIANRIEYYKLMFYLGHFHASLCVATPTYTATATRGAETQTMAHIWEGECIAQKVYAEWNEKRHKVVNCRRRSTASLDLYGFPSVVSRVFVAIRNGLHVHAQRSAIATNIESNWSSRIGPKFHSSKRKLLHGCSNRSAKKKFKGQRKSQKPNGMGRASSGSD